MRIFILIIVMILSVKATFAVQTRPERLCYQTKISYPTIANGDVKLNDAIRTVLAGIQAKYIQDLVQIQGKEASCRADNRLLVEYKEYNESEQFVSVLFEVSSMYYREAHPSNYDLSFNYDQRSGKVLTLDDLFQNEAEALRVLSEYSRHVLNSKLATGEDSKVLAMQKDFIKQGTEPLKKNFSDWIILKNSILLTFDPAQVAPYYMGRQQVEVPFDILIKVLKSPFAPHEDNEKK